MTSSMIVSLEESAAKTTGSLLRRWRRDAGYRRQTEFGKALGLSRRSVQAMESGTRMPTDTEIPRLTQLLRLNDEQRPLLWELTHRTPPAPSAPPSCEEEMLKHFMDSHPYPAIMMDARWDLQAANPVALSLWPWLRDPRHRNMLLRCLADPLGRLVNWEHEYASPLVEQLRLASIRSPGDRRLAELREAVLDGGKPRTREVLRRKWQNPDGRRLWLPHEVRVQLPAVSNTPMLLRQTRLTPEHQGLHLWLMEPITSHQAAL